MFDSVFDRGRGQDTMSESAYNGMIGLVLFYGFGVNWWIVSNFSPDAIPMWPLLIGYFISAFAGIFIAYGSDNPWVSFLGYNLVVVPVGFVLNVILQDYNQDIIINAVMVTAAVTGVMMVMGVMFPAFFKSIEGVLFWSLVAAIVVQLFLIFVLGRDLGIMDWIVALIFCGYIGLDWGRAQAQRLPTMPLTASLLSIWTSSIFSSAFSQSWGTATTKVDMPIKKKRPISGRFKL